MNFAKAGILALALATAGCASQPDNTPKEEEKTETETTQAVEQPQAEEAAPEEPQAEQPVQETETTEESGNWEAEIAGEPSQAMLETYFANTQNGADLSTDKKICNLVLEIILNDKSGEFVKQDETGTPYFDLGSYSRLLEALGKKLPPESLWKEFVGNHGALDGNKLYLQNVGGIRASDSVITDEKEDGNNLILTVHNTDGFTNKEWDSTATFTKGPDGRYILASVE